MYCPNAYVRRDFTLNKKISLSLYRIFSRAYFHLPFLVIYLFNLGFNLITIEIIMAVYGLAVFIYTKLPAKIKPSVLFSCKQILLLSELFKFIGLLHQILLSYVLHKFFWV